MKNVLSAAVRALPLGPLHTVRQFIDRPVQVQARLLRSLLHRAADTEWGRRYDFAGIARAPDVVTAYQRRVPLHTYDDLREDANRMRRGAAHVTWPGQFRHFAVSSGTVSDGKIIPLSQDMLDKDRRFSIGVGLNYLAETGDVRFLLGKHLSLPGHVQEDEPGSLVGEVSGLLAEHTPAFIEHIYEAVPSEVWHIENWDRKLRTVVDQTMDRDIRLLVMAPTWALVLFRLLIERYNRKHNAQVRTVGEIWPNLQVFISGGVALSSYRDLLARQIDRPEVDFLETYGASEGFFSFQTDLSDPAMLLHLDNGVFYEFVRLEDLHQAAPRRYTIGEVETGQRYALFVSTCSGLWAYDVGDVVRFTQTTPHKIVVAGRTSEMIDRYGEAVFSEEARSALEHACAEAGTPVRDFHVAPRPAGEEDLPSHQWLIEFEQEPADLRRFSAAIDAHLQQVNRHYQIRREARAFGQPEIVPLPQGTFRAWLRKTRGTVSGQSKVPRMSEERAVAEEILDAAGNNA